MFIPNGMVQIMWLLTILFILIIFFQFAGDRHVTQTLDWIDSIFQSSDNALGGKCRNEKWNNLILLCDPDGIGIHPFSMDI